MQLSCTSKMIKYLMFVFNLFFVISGIIIIAVGAAVKTVYTEYEGFLDNKYFSLPNMLIATGIFIFIISFFGCCGAIKESWIMLGIFSILLCIIFIFEFACGISGYVLRDQTANYLDETLTENLKNYKETSKIWDLIQNTFQCCGVNDFNDWREKSNNAPVFDLPISCCPRVSGTTGVFYCNSSSSTTSSTTVTTPGTSSSSSTTDDVESTSTTSSKPTTNNSDVTIASTTESAETTTNHNSIEISPSSSESSPTDESPNKARKRRAASLLAEEPTTTPPNPIISSPPYPTGCKEAFGDYVRKHAVQIGGCAMGLAVIQIIGVAFSVHLTRQLKNGYYST